MGSGNEPPMGCDSWGGSIWPSTGSIFRPRPLHLHRKLSGALLRLLSSPHRSGAHTPLWEIPSSGLTPEVSKRTYRRALASGAGGYAGPTQGERKGARHPGKYCVSSEIVPSSDTCLTRWSTFRTGAGPAWNPLLLGTRGGAWAPEHQRSEAASRPRVPSLRVVACPTCGASQMCNAELFV